MPTAPSPTRRLSRRFLAMALALAVGAGLLAESRPTEVAFRSVRANGGPEWIEVAIEIETRRDAADQTRRRADFNEDVSVELALAYESRAGGQEVFAFFRSAARLVALEEGEATLCFYLPPEIVERDRIRPEPHSFRVLVSAPGQEAQALYSGSLESEAARASFQRLAQERGPGNAGILRPLSAVPAFRQRWPDAPTERLPTDPADQ